MLKLTAKNVKLAVKVKSTADIFRTLDKALHYARHAVFCALPENIRIHRNLSPAEKFEVLLFARTSSIFIACERIYLSCGKKNIPTP